jgi:glycine betaine/choline ABC-type transport system substrate-binding protein
LFRSRSAAAAAAAAAALGLASTAVGAGTPVRIGDAGTPATRLVAELDGQALTAQGFTVTRVGFASAAAADAAVRSGSLDMYATETATLLERVVGHPKERDDARLGPLLAAALAPRGEAPVAPAPYDDAPQVACTKAAVRSHRLSGVASLGKAAPSLVYAATPPNVVRADGLAALRVRFRRVIVAPGSGRFDAVARRRAHCVESSGTEPRAVRLALVALRDRTRRFAGTPQHGVAVVRQAYLGSAPPVFGQTLGKIAALLTDATVGTLRGAVEIDGQDPAPTARDFLRANGVIP